MNNTYTPPDVGIGAIRTEYGYNLAKQPIIVTRPDGKTIGFTYDTSGRLQELLIPEGEITYAYHADNGNLTNILAPGSTMSYTYDGSLLNKTAWSGVISGSVSVTYNNDLMVTSQSVNGGNTVSYGYDDDGLLTSAGELTISRDAQNGMLTGSMLGSVSDSVSYNSFGELERYQARFGGNTIYSVDYGTRDKLGRIVTKTETVNGETHTYSYVYDPNTDELTEVYKDGALVSHYDYDDNGNRVKYTGADGTFNGTYDDQDRMLSYGGNTYQYTANGELKSKTNAEGTTVYDYDVLGNLRAVTLPDGTGIEYVIDGQNRRIGKKVNGTLVQGFLYQDALNPVAELDANGNVVSRFVYGTLANVPDYMIKGGVKYRIISDHLGSVRLVVNASAGDIVQKMEYDEFGKVILDTNPGFQPFGFAGGLYDKDTGLVRFGARDYDAEVGRWTAKDPIGFDGGDTNLYGYCFIDPVNDIDPSGLSTFTDCLSKCFKEHFGLTVAGGTGAVLTHNFIPTKAKPPGATEGTSIASKGLSLLWNKIEGIAPEFIKNRRWPTHLKWSSKYGKYIVIKTGNIGRAVGRYLSYASYALLFGDGFSIGRCTKRCERESGCGSINGSDNN